MRTLKSEFYGTDFKSAPKKTQKETLSDDRDLLCEEQLVGNGSESWQHLPCTQEASAERPTGCFQMAGGLLKKFRKILNYTSVFGVISVKAALGYYYVLRSP